jgi:hypothetical protein
MCEGIYNWEGIYNCSRVVLGGEEEFSVVPPLAEEGGAPREVTFCVTRLLQNESAAVLGSLRLWGVLLPLPASGVASTALAPQMVTALIVLNPCSAA